MNKELISKLNSGAKIGSEVAAALSFNNVSDIGYLMLRAKVLNCFKSHKALFNILVSLLSNDCGRVYAERLAGVILAEALNPRRCKTCQGKGQTLTPPKFKEWSEAGGKVADIPAHWEPCKACGGFGFHWLGVHQMAGLIGIDHRKLKKGQFDKAIKEWAACLMILESEAAQKAVI